MEVSKGMIPLVKDHIVHIIINKLACNMQVQTATKTTPIPSVYISQLLDFITQNVQEKKLQLILHFFLPESGRMSCQNFVFL